ncbi:MAG: hypothetical protein AAFZ15_32360 [Bacteroidota bacterium]
MFSCKDECDGVNCQNGGVCNDGTCACEPYYEGGFCETESCEKFLGTYTVIEDCSELGPSTFNVSIEKSDGINKIKFVNFYGIGLTVIAEINGNNFTITNYVDLGFIVNGLGSINTSGNIITLSYSVEWPDETKDNCSATFTI